MSALLYRKRKKQRRDRGGGGGCESKDQGDGQTDGWTDGRIKMERHGGIKFLITLQCQWKKKCEKCAREHPGFFLLFLFPSPSLSFLFFSFLFLLACQPRREYRRLASFDLCLAFPFSRESPPPLAFSARVSRKSSRLRSRTTKRLPRGSMTRQRSSLRHIRPPQKRSKTFDE